MAKRKRFGKHYVYIVECRQGMYYTGYTVDLERRVAKHNSGHGAKYLRNKLPVKLVYSKEYKYFKIAYKAEREIKKLSRQAKEALVREYDQMLNKLQSKLSTHKNPHAQIT